MVKAKLLSSWYLLMAPAMLFGASSDTTTIGPTGASATALLSQLSTAFSGGNQVHQVQLTGSASWHSGSLNDTGSATLSAAAAGLLQSCSFPSRLQAREQSNNRVRGGELSCTWAGEDRVAHSIDPGNCLAASQLVFAAVVFAAIAFAQLSGSA